jgi:quinol monooxygenase YgiN
VIVTLRISVPASMISHVTDLFEVYRGPVSARSGCIGVDLYTRFSNPEEFILVEEWSSRKALENHVRSDDFRKVLAIMDLADRPPDLRFHTVTSAEGFDLVVELRKEEGDGRA